MIFVDADACPVRAETVKVAERHGADVVFVTDGGLRPSAHPLLGLLRGAHPHPRLVRGFLPGHAVQESLNDGDRAAVANDP